MDRRKFLKILGVGAAALPFVKAKQVEAEIAPVSTKPPLPDRKLKLFDGDGNPYDLELEECNGVGEQYFESIKICFDEPKANPFFAHYELWVSDDDINYHYYASVAQDGVVLVPNFAFKKIKTVDVYGIKSFLCYL